MYIIYIYASICIWYVCLYVIPRGHAHKKTMACLKPEQFCCQVASKLPKRYLGKIRQRHPKARGPKESIHSVVSNGWIPWAMILPCSIPPNPCLLFNNLDTSKLLKRWHRIKVRRVIRISIRPKISLNATSLVMTVNIYQGQVCGFLIFP